MAKTNSGNSSRCGTNSNSNSNNKMERGSKIRLIHSRRHSQSRNAQALLTMKLLLVRATLLLCPRCPRSRSSAVAVPPDQRIITIIITITTLVLE